MKNKWRVQNNSHLAESYFKINTNYETEKKQWFGQVNIQLCQTKLRFWMDLLFIILTKIQKK